MDAKEVEELKEKLGSLQKENQSLKEQLWEANQQNRSRNVKHNQLSDDVWEDISNKCAARDIDQIKQLINKNVINMFDTNKNYETLLLIASDFGAYDIVNLCINLEADITHRNIHTKSALDLAQESGWYHIEQLLIFSAMNANIGNSIRDTSDIINKQNGINQNVIHQLNELSDSEASSFNKTLLTLMIHIISNKLLFSDDILSLCWSIVCNENNQNPLKSDLWETIYKTCNSIIHDGSKSDWFWLKTCILPSTIWYSDSDVDSSSATAAEPKCICDETLKLTTLKQAFGFDSDNDEAVVWCDGCGEGLNKKSNLYHCPKNNVAQHPNGYDLCVRCADQTRQKYLYFKLLHLVSDKSKKQLAKLDADLRTLSNQNKTDWNELIKWDFSDEHVTETVRQDQIPNGIEPQYTYNQLLEQSISSASSTTFNIFKFYDYNQYLSQLSLLAQIVDDSFQRSIQQMFADTDVKYMRGPVKLLKRARAKADVDYSNETFPTSACVLDFNRCSLVFDDISSLLCALKLFVNKIKYYQSGNIIGITRNKNGFVEYIKEVQYADIKLNVLIKGTQNNIIGEVQFLLQTMLDYKHSAHNLYAIQRNKEYIENSVSRILPMLLDTEKQLFVAGNMGNVRSLAQIMLNGARGERNDINQILRVNKVTAQTILHRICSLDHDKALLFLKSVLSKKVFLHHVFLPSSSDQKPIEYAVRYSSVSIVRILFSIKDIQDKYGKDENECFRLIFWLFAVCLNNDLKNEVLKILEISPQKIVYFLRYRNYPKVSYYDQLVEGHWQYSKYAIIARSVEHVQVSHWEHLEAVVGRKAFVDAVFVADGWNINAMERCLMHNKMSLLKYLWSLQEIKDTYLRDNNQLYRLLYCLFHERTTANVMNYVLSDMKIEGNKLLQLLSDFKYTESVEMQQSEYNYEKRVLLEQIACESGFSKLQILKSYVNDEAMFAKIIFARNEWNKNILEYSLSQKMDSFKYMLSIDIIKKRILNDNEIFFRIVWCFIHQNGFVNVAAFVKALQIDEPKLNQLKAFKCAKPEMSKYNKDAITYWDKTITDDDINGLLL